MFKISLGRLKSRDRRNDHFTKFGRRCLQQELGLLGSQVSSKQSHKAPETCCRGQRVCTVLQRFLLPLHARRRFSCQTLQIGASVMPNHLFRHSTEDYGNTKLSRGLLILVLVLSVFVASMNFLVLAAPTHHTTEQNEADGAPKTVPRTIFYNAYFDPGNERNGLGIVKEQLDQISSFSSRNDDTQWAIYFNTVGAPILNQTLLSKLCNDRNLTCQHLQHHEKAFEEVTLQSLYDYCQRQPTLRVAYMHNKGSFHSFRGRNDIWRRHLTAAALNENCWNPPNETCNVCGWQFFPVWTTFMPGNMWVSKCSYIRKLLPPTGFAARMQSLLETTMILQRDGVIVNNGYKRKFKKGMAFEGRYGLKRFAYEHWIGTHPDLQPCDVTTTKGDIFTFDHNESDFVWSMAPRQPIGLDYDYWQALRYPSFHAVLKDKERRMKEYFLLPGMLHKWINLYNETPPLTSWVWSWYPDGVEWREHVRESGVNVISETNASKV